MGPGRSPLKALAGLLRGAALPRPSRLVLLIGEAEDYACFLHLVDKFLPEHRAEIVAAGDTGDMIGAFIKRFGDRYFPLPDFAEGLSDFVQGFLPPVMGLEEDDYHDLPEGGLGVVLASLLVDLEGELELDSGVRVTLVEVAARSVPPDMGGLRHVAEKGYPLADFEALRGTPYEGALLHAQYLCHQTDCDFLDATQEEVTGLFEWSRNNVEEMTVEWARAEQFSRCKDAFFDWLEEDPEGHFRQVISRLEGRNDGECSEHQLRLPLGPARGD